MARQGRGLFAEIISNIISSLRPNRYKKGNLIGTDYMGTKYFEIPANQEKGLRRPYRSFEPSVQENFDQSLPPEWEAWLRGRRKDPPTTEEISRNLGIIRLKEKNAAEISLKFPSKNSDSITKKKGLESFPSYSEYERVPGVPSTEDKKRNDT